MEKLEWNLDELFKNDEEFYYEIENVKDLIKEITSYQKKRNKRLCTRKIIK